LIYIDIEIPFHHRLLLLIIHSFFFPFSFSFPQVESLLDLPSLPAIDPSAASESDPAAAVEKPRARMLPHDEPELIAGSFTTMMASTQRVLPDPSFLRSRNEPDSPNTPGAPKLPALKGAIKN